MRRRFLRAGSMALVALPALLTGCWAGRSGLETDLVMDAGSDAPPVVDAGPPPLEKSSKLDLLLVVDNSPNTQAFHELLAATVPYLLGRLTRPACVNGLGNVVALTALPTDPCPTGVREFQPI